MPTGICAQTGSRKTQVFTCGCHFPQNRISPPKKTGKHCYMSNSWFAKEIRGAYKIYKIPKSKEILGFKRCSISSIPRRLIKRCFSGEFLPCAVHVFQVCVLKSGKLIKFVARNSIAPIYMNTKEKPADSMTSMSDRHKKILEILQLQGSISVTDLSERLNVSEVTIRKDLTALETQNKLYRTHGKAIPISPYIGDRHINEKEKQNVQEKRLIGRRAASMLEDNDSILIASGTTILYAAREMVSARNLTVITASVSVSSILSQNKYIDVVQLGGMVRESSVSVVGSFAEDMLSYFNCSKLFMGADGVDLEFGVTTTNMMEANLNRMMMSSAQKTILLVDSSKFGKKGFSKICDLEKIDQIITDDKIPQVYLENLEELGIEVTVV